MIFRIFVVQVWCLGCWLVDALFSSSSFSSINRSLVAVNDSSQAEICLLFVNNLFLEEQSYVGNWWYSMLSFFGPSLSSSLTTQNNWDVQSIGTYECSDLYCGRTKDIVLFARLYMPAEYTSNVFQVKHSWMLGESKAIGSASCRYLFCLLCVALLICHIILKITRVLASTFPSND